MLLQSTHRKDGEVFVPLRLRPALRLKFQQDEHRRRLCIQAIDSNGIDRSYIRDTRVSFSRRRRCCYATTTATADAPARRTSIGAACHCSFPAGLVESQDLINQRNLPRLYLSPTTGSTGDPRRTGLRGSSAISRDEVNLIFPRAHVQRLPSKLSRLSVKICVMNTS